MKLIVKNPNKIVSSAFIEEAESGDSWSLYINTNNKWVDFSCHSIGCSSIDLLDELVFYFNSGKNNLNLDDKVIVKAGSEEENEKLNRLMFKSHDKSQIWLLFPKEEVYL